MPEDRKLRSHAMFWTRRRAQWGPSKTMLIKYGKAWKQDQFNAGTSSSWLFLEWVVYNDCCSVEDEWVRQDTARLLERVHYQGCHNLHPAVLGASANKMFEWCVEETVHSLCIPSKASLWMMSYPKPTKPLSFLPKISAWQRWKRTLSSCSSHTGKRAG